MTTGSVEVTVHCIAELSLFRNRDQNNKNQLESLISVSSQKIGVDYVVAQDVPRLRVLALAVTRSARDGIAFSPLTRSRT